MYRKTKFYLTVCVCDILLLENSVLLDLLECASGLQGILNSAINRLYNSYIICKLTLLSEICLYCVNVDYKHPTRHFTWVFLCLVPQEARPFNTDTIY